MAQMSFFEVEPWEKEYLNKAMQTIERRFITDLKMTFTEDRLTQDNIAEYKDADVISVFIFSQIDAEMLDKMPHLKHINTMSTGFDHIDIKECAKRNISVSTVPSYGENTVAEHAMALLLAISRKLIPSIERTRKGNFETGPALRGFDLKGKTIGVIGTGRIGRHVIQYCKAFGMNVIAYDAFPNEQAAKELGFTYEKELEDLLSKSDVITLHAPGMPQTQHMINMKNIDRVKKGCVYINTARGSLVETEALFYAMQNGIFSAAGIDVLEEETGIKEDKQLLSKHFEKVNLRTLLEEHVLLEFDNVIMTPHNAFNSTEALTRILDTSVENIAGFLKKVPTNLVKA